MKTIKILLIILLSLIIIGITLFFINILGYNGITFFGTKESKNIVYKEEYDDVFTDIAINSKFGNVYVNETNEKKVIVEIYGNKERTKVNAEYNTLFIETDVESCTILCFNREASKVIITLPRDYAYNLSIMDNYGSVFVGEFDNMKLKATLKAGNIKVLSANILNVTNNFGDISIGKVNEKMEIIENFGNIEIKNINIMKDSSIRNDFGNIKIDDTNEINIKAKTSLGKTKINNNYKMSLITLNIRNNFGNITVNN